MKEGFILGKNQDGEDIIDNGYQSVLLFAPTGAGKSVSFMIPGLLSWQESAIVHDIKGENFKMTSGQRASYGQKIFIWSPLSSNKQTHRFNPLDFITQIGDIYKLASNIINSNNSLHSSEAKNLFIGIVCYLFASPTRLKTLGEVTRVISGNLIDELTLGLREYGKSIDKSGLEAIFLFLQQDPNIQQEIATVLYSYLEIFANPLVDYATSASDFDLRNFKKEKSTLYVSLKPDEILMLQPLMQFFYQYALALLISDDATQKNECGVMFFMDEFLTMGKISNLVNIVSYLRGYSVKLLLIAQNFEHFKMVYGEQEARMIAYNVANTISFGTHSQETAKFFSEISNNKISADEIMALSRKEEMILNEDDNVLKAYKNIYYENSDYKKEVSSPPIFW